MSNETELEKARRRVKEGALRISRHRELMAELRAEDKSTVIAERILAEFEKIQTKAWPSSEDSERPAHLAKEAAE